MKITLWILIIGLWFPVSVLSETTTLVIPEIAKLHNLTKDELITKSQDIFNEASDKFRSELRGVFGNERLLELARKKTGSLIIPAKKFTTPSENISSLEIAKATLDHVRGRFDAFKRWLVLTETEKNLIEKQIDQIKIAQSTADIFIDKLDNLDSFILEIELRLDDGTLTDSEVPSFLNTQEMEKQILIVKQGELEEKLNKTQESFDEIILRLEKIKKNTTRMEANYSANKEKYSKELKRQKVEQEYSKQTPEQLLAEIAKLQEERVWVNGTFNLSYRKFMNQQKNIISKLEQEFGELSPPDVTKLQITYSEEAQQTTTIAKEIVHYHVKKIVKLKKLQKNLKSLIEYGESHEGDATVLNEHTFKIKVIARTLENFVAEKKLELDSIPENSRSKSLTIVDDKFSKQVSNALDIIEKARERLAQIDDEIEKSNIVQKEVKEKLVNLRKIYESAQQANQWEEKLKDLTAEQILRNFQESGEKFVQYEMNLQKLQEDFKIDQTTVENSKLSLESLKDPLFRLVQQEIFEEKQNILNMLYKFTKLELPTQEIQTQSTDVKDKASEYETEAYQNLLSNRIRVIDKQQEQRINLSKILNSLSEKIKHYTQVLSETSKIASQHYANAVELKKRLGRGQLDADEIPDGISEALKSHVVTQLNDKTTEMINYQTNIQQQITSLNQKDETLQETQIFLIGIQSLAGKRIDLTLEHQKLKQDFEHRYSTLSKTELKTLEQTANRRMESDNTTTEFILSFIPSGRADSLTEFMQDYYLELLELENKKENLQMQKNKIERLTKLAESEKILIKKLLPLLKQQKEQLENKKETELVKIQAKLMPKKAEEKSANFENKIKNRLSISSAISEEQKVFAIEEATDKIFDLHTQIIAIDKWSALFEQRLSSTGINVEIGDYQDKLGILNAKGLTIQRRIKRILGHSQDEFTNLDNEKLAKHFSKLRFLQGEIGVLRVDIHKIRTQQTLQVFIKLIMVLLITMLITWITNRLVNFILRNSYNTKHSLLNEKPIGTFTIILPLLRTIFIFILWVSATIVGLSILGFNAGAVLAGLGIGGLAIAMASQKTLSDMIGGISILLARSFKIGDIILFNGEPSTVEDISLRYTRLREYSTDYLHTIPNSLLSEQKLTNISAAKQGIYLTMELPLSIGNSADKLELAMQIIVDVIGQNPNSSLRWMRFHGFENYTFTIKASFEVKWTQKEKIQTEIYTEVVRRLQQNDIGFTFPV